ILSFTFDTSEKPDSKLKFGVNDADNEIGAWKGVPEVVGSDNSGRVRSSLTEFDCDHNIPVNYVTKDINSPNVSQTRPIENSWVCLSEKVYEGGWQASNEQQLINGIRLKFCEIPYGGGQSKAQKNRPRWNFFII
ncbi:hypothetical protein BpHYR1_035952, partial [Brachionus plicatilis]